MAAHKRTLPADLALSNPTRPPASRRRALASSLYDPSASPWTTQTALAAHHSCVNALSFSKHDGGRYLASGGDDKRVLLWDTARPDQDSDDRQGSAADPVGCYRGATSNIFTTAFSCDGQKLLSGGNDAVVIVHDLETSSASFPHALHEGIPPATAFIDPGDAVMSISPHPQNPALFIAAASDSLMLFDLREGVRSIAVTSGNHSMDHVEHHPLSPDLFVYAGDDGNMGLLDARTAWGTGDYEGSSYLNVADKVALHKVALHKYHANLVRAPGRSAKPTLSSFTFDSTGAIFCATVSGYLPTLYELSEPSPLATFSSPAPTAPAPNPSPSSAPAGAEPLAFPQGYRNSTTTKHGSFGGGPGAAPGHGLYYAAGSDDFRTYTWEVPSLESLRERKKQSLFGAQSAGEVAYYDGKSTSVVVPASVSPASSILTGHRSIVNTALHHPTLPLLYTSGIEKHIVRHSPGQPNSISLEATETDTSNRPGWHFVPRTPEAHFIHPGLTGPSDPCHDPTLRPGESHREREIRLRSEDREVLEYFDGLVEAEGEDMLWREGRMRGDDEDSDFGSGDEEFDEESLDRLREMMEAGGPLGSTRRVLNQLYALEGDSEDGSSEEEEEEEEDENDDQAVE